MQTYRFTLKRKQWELKAHRVWNLRCDCRWTYAFHERIHPKILGIHVTWARQRRVGINAVIFILLGTNSDIATVD